MKFHEMSWTFVKFGEFSGNFVKFGEFSWNFVKLVNFHEISWNFANFHDISWIFMKICQCECCKKFRGSSWSSLSTLQILQLFSPFAAISVSCAPKKFRHMFLIGVFYLIVAGRISCKIHILYVERENYSEIVSETCLFAMPRKDVGPKLSLRLRAGAYTPVRLTYLAPLMVFAHHMNEAALRKDSWRSIAYENVAPCCRFCLKPLAYTHHVTQPEMTLAAGVRQVFTKLASFNTSMSWCSGQNNKSGR